MAIHSASFSDRACTTMAASRRGSTEATWDESTDQASGPHRKKSTASRAPHRETSQRCRERKQKELDLQGIEPWTTPMLREYYTTKPQARTALLFALMKGTL
jgi:hypothetical protein